MIFRKLSQVDYQSTMAFLLQKPEYNLFIIGDIENYGFETTFQKVWGMVDEQGKVHGVLLKYYNSYLPSAHDPEIIKKFAPLISLGAKLVSGEKKIINCLKKYLNSDIIKDEKEEYFARLHELNDKIVINNEYMIKKAGLVDVDRILKLRGQIEEFSSIPANRDSIVKKLQQSSGRDYFVENDQGRIISSAATTAENSRSAMIVGVATLKEYRCKGLATGLVYRLCQDLLAEKKIPCLFYDNPKAGEIYKKIGFRDIGWWNILQLK